MTGNNKETETVQLATERAEGYKDALLVVCEDMHKLNLKEFFDKYYSEPTN